MGVAMADVIFRGIQHLRSYRRGSMDGPGAAEIAPVTPGKPVMVRIALADACEGAFDSAEALVDGGTWSD